MIKIRESILNINPVQSSAFHNRLKRRVITGLLLTSLLIGASFSVLFYQFHVKQLKKELLFEIDLHTAAITSEISRLQSFASQLTTRSHIREELEKYNQGQIKLESLTAISIPVLIDAMRRAPDVIGVERMDSKGNSLLTIGSSIPLELMPESFLSNSTQLGIPRKINGRYMLVVSAPIYGQNTKKIGVDLVMFNCKRLMMIMQRFFGRYHDYGYSSIAVINKEGVHSFLEAGEVTEHLVSDWIKDIISQLSGYQSSIYQPENRSDLIIAYKPLGVSDWIYLFHTMKSSIFAPPRIHALVSIIALVTLALIGSLITVLFIRPLAGRVSVEMSDLHEVLEEREELLEKISRNEANLKEAQRLSLTGSWELDLETHKLTWSEEIFRIFQCGIQDFDGTFAGFLYRVYPLDREMVKDAYAESVEKRKPCDIIHRILLDDGSIKYVQECCETIYSDDGEPIKSIGTVQDISDVHKARLELMEREKEFSFIFESLPSLLYLKDAKDLRILRINKDAVKFLGKSRDEVIGHHVSELLPKEKAQEIDEMERRVIETGETVEIHDEFFETQEGVIYLNTKKLCIRDNEGQPRYLLCINEDVTQFKVAEKKLQYRLKLEEALTNVSTRIAQSSFEELEGAMQDALESIGTAVCASRSYIFQVNDDETTFSNTLEWCAPGIEPRKDDVQDLPIQSFEAAFNLFRVGNPLFVDDPENLGDDFSELREIMRSGDVTSMVNVPVLWEGILLGFVGFDTDKVGKTWPEEDVRLLRMSAETIGWALAKREVSRVV